MHLGIMQPYLFPYSGYFSLMRAVDRWIVFDTPQYIRRGWVNRNRVLMLGNDDWKYIKIPTKKARRDTPINQIKIRADSGWAADIIHNLDYYKQHRAPYYALVTEFLASTLAFKTELLSALLTHCLRSTCELLGMLPAEFQVFSETNLSIGPVTHAGEWALRISESVNAETYINSIGGRSIFEPDEFRRGGVSLRFLTPDLKTYDQRRSDFVAGLSIIDTLMWLGPEDTRRYIEHYELVDA